MQTLGMEVSSPPPGPPLPGYSLEDAVRELQALQAEVGESRAAAEDDLQGLRGNVAVAEIHLNHVNGAREETKSKMSELGERPFSS